MLAIGGGALYLPARRASRVDPLKRYGLSSELWDADAARGAHLATFRLTRNEVPRN